MGTRIEKHPILRFKRGRPVRFTFDGHEMTGREGETIAVALLANGISVFSRSSRHHRPRGFFCAVGKCASCFVIVDDVPNVRSCVTPIKEGMRIQTQTGRAKLSIRKITQDNRA